MSEGRYFLVGKKSDILEYEKNNKNNKTIYQYDIRSLKKSSELYKSTGTFTYENNLFRGYELKSNDVIVLINFENSTEDYIRTLIGIVQYTNGISKSVCPKIINVSV